MEIHLKDTHSGQGQWIKISHLLWLASRYLPKSFLKNSPINGIKTKKRTSSHACWALGSWGTDTWCQHRAGVNSGSASALGVPSPSCINTDAYEAMPTSQFGELLVTGQIVQWDRDGEKEMMDLVWPTLLHLLHWSFSFLPPLNIEIKRALVFTALLLIPALYSFYRW